MGRNRHDPLKDLVSIQERVNKLFEDIADKGEYESVTRRTWSPSVDIYESDNEFVVKAELPEVNKDDLEIKVEENVITISGERKFQKDVNTNNFHRVERKYGHFKRSFRLPSSIDQESIKADLTDGILKIVLHKKGETESKRIEVE